jgi:hypothetical protein
VPAPRTEGGENRGCHVFDRFGQAAAEQGRTVARFETWESHEELRLKTDAEFEAELEERVEFLRERGCGSGAMVAKSFGGRLAPASARRVDQLVLWAPAVAFGEREERPSITVDALSDVEVPVRILQGDDEDVESVETPLQSPSICPTGNWSNCPARTTRSRTTKSGRSRRRSRSSGRCLA